MRLPYWERALSTTSDLVEKFAFHYNQMGQWWNRRNSSRPQRTYLKRVRALTAMVREVADNGTFEEQLSVLKDGQLYDMQFFAASPPEEQNFLDSMESLQIGEIHYNTLRDFPDVYRERLAAGFQKKDRLAPERIVPKDGMHKALSSYARHLSARHSPLIAEEKKELFHAMIELAEKMAELYHSMQRRTMGLAEHGE